MRPLDITRDDTALHVSGPVVLESGDSSNPNKIVTNLTTGDDQVTWSEDGTDQSAPLPNGSESVTVTPDATMMTIDAGDGGSLTVRRLTDEDGLWASALHVPAPTESLEDLHGGSMPNTDESLWAAIDPDTEVLQQLIYSSAAGIYARAQGGWFRYPDEDESLDGLESVDVDPKMVDVFDKADSQGDELSRDDVMKYALPEEEEPAEEPAPDDEAAEPVPDDEESETEE